jgi:hypothetical protein
MAMRPAIMQKKCVVMLCGARRNSAPESAFRLPVWWLSTLWVFPAAVVGAWAPCGLPSPQIQFEIIVKGNQHVLRSDSYSGGCSKLGTRKRVRASLLSRVYRSMREPNAFLGAFAMQFRTAAISPVLSIYVEHCDTEPTDYCEITYMELLLTLINDP